MSIFTLKFSPTLCNDGINLLEGEFQFIQICMEFIRNYWKEGPKAAMDIFLAVHFQRGGPSPPLWEWEREDLKSFQELY